MRTPTGAGPRIVDIAWPVDSPRSGIRRWPLPDLRAAALGISLGLLFVRILHVLGGPPWLAGPVAATAAALLGALAGTLWIARWTLPGRTGAWATALGLIWLLLLFQPVGPATVLGVAGLTLAWCVAAACPTRYRLLQLPLRLWVLAGGAALTAFLLNWPRLARTVVPGDSGEFQALIPSLGIPHPTGYPLFVLLGKAATWLPFGEPAFSLSVFSAALGAVTVAFVLLLAYEASRDELASLLVAALFAFNPLFVAQAVVPEVYTLHLALLAAVLWLFARWQQTWSPRVLALLALALGAGLAHHRTFVLVVPCLLLAALLTPRPTARVGDAAAGLSRLTYRLPGRIAPRTALPALALFLLPILSYLYFPWRWPAATGRAITWPDFSELVFANRFQSLVDLSAALSLDRYAILFALLDEQITGLGLAIGATGLIAWLLVTPYRAVAVAGLGTLSLLFGAVYQVPDVGVFLLPATLALTVGIAVAARMMRVWTGGWGQVVIVLALAAVVLQQLSLWQPDAPGRQIQAEARAGIAALPPGPVLVISDVEHFSPLLYAARVLHQRRDVEIVMPDTHEQAYELIEDSQRRGRPVFLARHLPRLAERFSVEAAGPLIAVAPRRADRPAESGREVAPGIQVHAVEAPDRVRRGDRLAVSLTWLLERPVAEALRPAWLLAGMDGQVVAAGPIRDPVAGLFPFPLWPEGEPVRDFQTIAVPDHLAAGEYELWVLLLRPGERVPQRIADFLPAGEPLGRVTVLPAGAGGAAGLPRVLSVGDDLRLLSFERPAAVEAGRSGDLALVWQATSATPRRQLRVELAGGTRLETVVDLPPLAAGESLTTRVVLPAVGAGAWPVNLSVLDSGRPLPLRSAWYRPAEESAHLTLLRVTPPAQAVPTFDDRMHVLEAEFPPEVGPDDTFSVRFRWRATALPRGDYTVFVHVIDEAGRVVAQVDSRPRLGTLPTHQWPLETEIDDRYDIPLRGRITPGRYRVLAGIYDARTMVRLPVTGADGRPVSDHLDLGELTVRAADQ